MEEMICKIRKWELSDATDLATVLSDKKIQNNLRDGLLYPYTEQDGAEYISAMLSADENETFAFAITMDNKVVGSIGIFRQGNIHRQTVELGYYIAEEYWGKGIMTEAVKQICEYVFAKSDIIRIYAELFAYNRASCRVLEKAGYQIREIRESEYLILADFLHEAIFIPEGMKKPPKSIIKQPELQVHITDFEKEDDWCLVAETKEKIVGAVWACIMNDYGYVDDETPSFSIFLYEEYRHLGIGTALMRAMLQSLYCSGQRSNCFFWFFFIENIRLFFMA